MTDNLLAALARDMPEDERLILCGFRGDPGRADPTAWRPRPWRPGSDFPFDPPDNAYVTVSSFRRAGDGSFRRRGATFAAGRALMVDDVGTKVSRAAVAHVEPSFAIETSPGNEQWWYLLEEPIRDAARFDGIIRAFIAGKLLGADPGMSGVTRVGRLPGFVNGKPQHGGWVVKTVRETGLRFSAEDLIRVFDLKIIGRREPRVRLPTELALQRNRSFETIYLWLDQRNMLKRAEPDPSGWTEMKCPWMEDHTGGVNTGAAIREPAEENDWYGAFRCHHGHCADRGWAELTEFVAEASAEILEAAAEKSFDIN
jgi:hypothetical protein